MASVVRNLFSQMSSLDELLLIKSQDKLAAGDLWLTYFDASRVVL